MDFYTYICINKNEGYMITEKKLAKMLAEYVNDLYESDSDVTYRIPLDGDLAVYLGFDDGFDENDECALHSRKQPSFCVCVKVAENSPSALWEDANMPWSTDDGEVYDTDISISPHANYDDLAGQCLQWYAEIRRLLDEGELTF